MSDQSDVNSALSGANLSYLESQLENYERNPDSLSAQWQNLFANGFGSAGAATSVAASGGAIDFDHEVRQLGVSRLIDAYRQLGCRIAAIDPLEIDERPGHPSLEMGNYGLSLDDLPRDFSSDIPGFLRGTLGQFIEVLNKTYCGRISAEFMHITDPDERKWFIDHYESTHGNPDCSKTVKLHLLERLVAADMLEKYLNTRYTGQKRFSLEGGDMLVTVMDDLTRIAVAKGCKEACIGMAHRGRLNLLINLMGKNPSILFDEFEGKHASNIYGSGDVKYHMGFSSNLKLNDNLMHLALGFNPSHLEIVNPVIQGSVWARQVRRNDFAGDEVLPIIIHGDSALSGQGINMETLNMSQTRGYSTGGTVHVVVNNQVGFTTSDIRDVRSTYWCTDLAKMAECPVFHVNGNDPEAGYLATRLALAYRYKFHKDVFIDIVCYRRHGHNEQDEPKVTQPYMYSKVGKLKSPANVYATQLQAEGVIDASTEDQLRKDYVALLEQGKPANPLAEAASSSEFVDWSKHDPNKCKWNDKYPDGLSEAKLKKIAKKLVAIPDGFTPHGRVMKIIEARTKMGAGEVPVDWGMAENLAYASLLEAGYPVRISGQDVGRGTFFHRHAVWHDQNRQERDGNAYVPMAHLDPKQPTIDVVDSLLSESAVLGFEYGVSLTSPSTLVVWEAQFGDFANNAQVVIDQFISSGEYKWARLSSIVMLLPHGYEGQGPEHSSARIERYMQLCAEYNMQVCVPTTAAQIYHLLRRQILRPMRRPLIVMTPKSLLRNKAVASPLSDLAEGGFKTVIDEANKSINKSKVKRLVICYGKVYYDLCNERAERGLDDIAIVRFEQLYPFPHDDFAAVLKGFKSIEQVVWCQEEPGNQGAWHRIQHYLQRSLGELEMTYALRPSSASTATGLQDMHKKQQAALIAEALGVK